MNKCFITGCDSKTEWQLPWFVENLRKHSSVDLVIADFGMSDDMVSFASMSSSQLIVVSPKAGLKEIKGWMRKPLAMTKSPYRETVWLDTDCHVKGDIDDIFGLIKPHKLLMAEDKPWSTRRGEKWHNSGVVGFSGKPKVLVDWSSKCMDTEIDGDQEVLHWMMGGDELRRMSFIEDLPRKYNTLRLDVLDNTQPNDIRIMHWTGAKGNDEIRKMIRNA